MKLVHIPVLAALALGLAAGAAYAADTTSSSSSSMSSSSSPEPGANTLGIDVSKLDSASSQQAYYNSLSPTEQTDLKNRCTGAMGGADTTGKTSASLDPTVLTFCQMITK